MLCWIDAEELRIEHKSDKVGTLFVAAAIYLFIFVVMIGVKYKKKRVVSHEGYQALDTNT